MPTTYRGVIYDITTGDSAVSAIIGDRCYPDVLPEDVTLPAISYIPHVSDDDSIYRTHDAGPRLRTWTRTQFNLYADTGDEAESLSAAMTRLWSGQKASLGALLLETGGFFLLETGGYLLLDGYCTIGHSEIAGVTDTRDPALNRFRVILDVLVEHARQ